jgi:hypothetical protein
LRKSHISMGRTAFNSQTVLRANEVPRLTPSDELEFIGNLDLSDSPLG